MQTGVSILDALLPHHIAERLRNGLVKACDAMPGFNSPATLLIAPKTRTSSPVRIRREKASGECVGLSRLFLEGEGSIWAGCMTSSALNGELPACGVLRLLLR